MPFLCVYMFSPLGAVDLSHVQFYLSVNNLEGAQRALQTEYNNATSREEKEQLQYQMAQVALRQKDTQKAIDIFRNMLIKNPALLRVRCELASLYFTEKQDDLARYHARLALSDKNLPKEIQQNLLNLLDAIRRRKSWKLYVSIGMAPDSNINMVSGRRLSCVNFMGTPICHELDKAEADIGFQGFAGLEYIYKFSDTWGVKSRLTVDALDYQEKQYSFWGVGGQVGPRYVTDDAEYSVGVSYRQQWNDEHRYIRAKGLYAESSWDLSKRFYLYGRLTYFQARYDVPLYTPYNSDNYNGYARLVYNLNNRSYMALSAALAYEDSVSKWNSSLRQTYGVGYGRELPWGFVTYVEPNISWTRYQQGRYFFNGHGGIEWWKRKDTTYGVFISLSNKLLRIYNIMPTLNFVYHKRTSNVFNYDYERTRWEIGVSRSF